MDILLVGENYSFVRILSLELALMGPTVKTATESQSLKDSLENHQPDVVVLDHAGPVDLFVLNPRHYGYRGLLVILIDGEIPEQTLAALEDAHLIRKPVPASALLVQLQHL